ncbi:MAG: lysine exporter LysO family protein [Clostridiales bacterium]|nr:lysine exporter LysO family protein [Clostridiales bacterium]
MTTKIIFSVILGIITGIFILPETMAGHIGIMIDIGLCLLLFFVGIDIGKQGDIFSKIKDMGIKIILVPIMIGLGSIVGAMLAGILLKIPLNQAGAIGAGFGWYSLSAIELSKYSSKLGALAFITNVSREVIAIMIIPFVAKYIGKLESIAPAGATAMDTTLPIISSVTDSDVAIISFISGVILSAAVPIIVPMFMMIS